MLLKIKSKHILAIAIAITCIALLFPLRSVYPDFRADYSLGQLQREINLEIVNDLLGERTVFQSINMKNSAGQWLNNVYYTKDDQISILLHISNDRYYLFKDGSENDWLVRMRFKNFSDAYSNWRNQGILIGRLKKHYSFLRQLLKTHPEENPEVQVTYQNMHLEIYNYDPIYRVAVQKLHKKQNELISYQVARNLAEPMEKQLKEEIATIKQEIQKREQSYNDLLKNEYTLRENENLNNANQTVKELQFQSKEILFKPVANVLKNQGLTTNDIDNKVDSLTIVSRNSRRLLTQIQKVMNTNDNLSINDQIQKLYDTLRNQHIEEYTALFRSAVRQSEKDLVVWTKTDRVLYSPENCGPPPVQTSADNPAVGHIIRILTGNHTELLAEDCNGDGTTETFMVWSPDYFNWGDRNIPNALIIYNNTNPQITPLIADLVNYYRTLGLTANEEDARINNILEKEPIRSKRDIYLRRGDFSDLK